MTDTSAAPIVVHDSPTQPTLEAVLRLSLVAAGSVAGALGFTGVAGKLSVLLVTVGPVGAALAAGYGLFVTWRNARRSATMARALPDSVATTK